MVGVCNMVCSVACWPSYLTNCAFVLLLLFCACLIASAGHCKGLAQTSEQVLGKFHNMKLVLIFSDFSE